MFVRHQAESTEIHLRIISTLCFFLLEYEIPIETNEYLIEKELNCAFRQLIMFRSDKRVDHMNERRLGAVTWRDKRII
jgi:hypothetical protein